MVLKTEKLRVLIFIDWFLPGDKSGGPVRSCANLIDHLENEFDFSIVTRDTDYTETQSYSTITSDAWNILLDGKRVYYISASQLNKETISNLLSEEKYDVVYLNGIWSQAFTAWPMKELKKLKFKGKVIVAARGMLAPSALAIKATKKKLYLYLSKWRNDFSNVIFHATNLQEACDIRKVIGYKNKILLAENLPRKISLKIKHAIKSSNKLRVISVARVAPEKNTLYAIEVLSKVNVAVQADFYGPVYDQEYWNECKVAAEKLPANIKLRFLGPIPSTIILNTFSNYDLFFLPTRGENFGHVILESMQAGTPVLISDQTPWKNLQLLNVGWNFSLKSQEQFVDAIEQMAHLNTEEFERLSENATRFSENYVANTKLMEDSKQLFIS